MMEEWISTKDRLPEDGNSVLICRYNKDLKFFSPDIDNYQGYGNWWNDKDYNKEIWEVTHWMPLPEPPKGE